ncbi:MAG: VirB3 family type IV secretion system protein [Cetobacterium sp.]
MKKTEHLRVPSCHQLFKSQTMCGISREAFILNSALGLMSVVIFETVLVLLVFVLIYFILYFSTKKDPIVLTIFLKKYIKQKDYYHEN